MPRCFSFICLALTLVIIFFSTTIFSAHAADQSSASPCLAKTKTELAGKKPDAERDALLCVIDTLAALDQRERDFEQGKQSSGVVRLPVHSDANQQGR